jgi:hypothetical protein
LDVPPTAVITPAAAVIVDPSTLHAPNVLALHCGIAGAASERIAVVALPFTAAVPIVAVGFAKLVPPVGAWKLGSAAPPLLVKTKPEVLGAIE